MVEGRTPADALGDAVASVRRHDAEVKRWRVYRARAIADAIADGATVKGIAEALGVPRSTVYAWLRAGGATDGGQ